LCAAWGTEWWACPPEECACPPDEWECPPECPPLARAGAAIKADTAKRSRINVSRFIVAFPKRYRRLEVWVESFCSKCPTFAGVNKQRLCQVAPDCTNLLFRKGLGANKGIA
jgi:hypothetical protein